MKALEPLVTWDESKAGTCRVTLAVRFCYKSAIRGACSVAPFYFQNTNLCRQFKDIIICLILLTNELCRLVHKKSQNIK